MIKSKRYGYRNKHSLPGFVTGFVGIVIPAAIYFLYNGIDLPVSCIFLDIEILLQAAAKKESNGLV